MFKHLVLLVLIASTSALADNDRPYSYIKHPLLDEPTAGSELESCLQGMFASYGLDRRMVTALGPFDSLWDGNPDPKRVHYLISFDPKSLYQLQFITDDEAGWKSYTYTENGVTRTGRTASRMYTSGLMVRSTMRGETAPGPAQFSMPLQACEDVFKVYGADETHRR